MAKKEKHYRLFGEVRIISGKETKTIVQTQFLRIRKDTGEVLLNEEGLAEVMKPRKEDINPYGLMRQLLKT